MEKIFAFLKDSLPLIAYFPLPAQLVFGTASFLMILAFVLFVANYQAAKKTQDGIANDKSLPTLVRQGAESRRPYVLESVTQIVQPDPSYYDPKAKETDVTVRIVYTIFAREDVKVGDFPEEFRSTTGDVAWLAGSEIESKVELGARDKKRIVGLAMSRGERRTIVTSARYHYSLPFPEKRELHRVAVGPDEDIWCYDNDEDVIGQLTIMIQSDRPVEVPSKKEAFVDANGAQTAKIPEGNVFLRHDDEQSDYAVVASWDNVLPHQNCVLKVRYRATAGTRFAAHSLRPAA